MVLALGLNTRTGLNLYVLIIFAGDEIKDLHARLVGLQQTRESEKEQYQSLLQKAQTELQETKDQLTSENMILSKCC